MCTLPTGSRPGVSAGLIANTAVYNSASILFAQITSARASESDSLRPCWREWGVLASKKTDCARSAPM